MPARNALAPSMTNRYLQVRRQPLIPQAREQRFHRGGILGSSQLDAENMLAAFAIDAHSAEDMVSAEALAIDVNDQQISLDPSGAPAVAATARRCLRSLGG